jgi:hypothetical protein
VDALPDFPEGLVAFVATAGDAGPHVIPVSALHRAGPRRLLLALTHRRGTLARLRARPEVALALTGTGFAVTAHGRAAVVADPLPGAEFMVAVAVDVERLADHLRPETELRGGIDWGWREPAAAERHDQVVAALAALAAR